MLVGSDEDSTHISVGPDLRVAAPLIECWVKKDYLSVIFYFLILKQ